MSKTGSSISAVTPTRSCSEKGIVKMPTMLPSRQMNTDNGILPRAMAVITVPETMPHRRGGDDADPDRELQRQEPVRESPGEQGDQRQRGNHRRERGLELQVAHVQVGHVEHQPRR